MENEHMRDYEVARVEIDEMMKYITGILAVWIDVEGQRTCASQD